MDVFLQVVGFMACIFLFGAAVFGILEFISQLRAAKRKLSMLESTVAANYDWHQRDIADMRDRIYKLEAAAKTYMTIQPKSPT